MLTNFYALPMTSAAANCENAWVGSYGLAGLFKLRVSVPGSRRLVAGLGKILGPMAIPRVEQPDIDCVIHTMGWGERENCWKERGGYTFEQVYKGGRWRLWANSLELPCRIEVSVDRLGRVMYFQAGVMSLLRLILGLRGVVWLHGGFLVWQRDGEPTKGLVLVGPSGVGKSVVVGRAVGRGWSYVTDDHTLVSEAGVSGVSTPLSLRCYGLMPRGVGPSWSVWASRWGKWAARHMTRGGINLFTAVPLRPNDILASPPFLACPTDLCFIEHGERVSCRPVSGADMMRWLEADWRLTGRYMEKLIADSTGPPVPVCLSSFWKQQRRVAEGWVERCRCLSATVPARLRDDDCDRLLDQLAPAESAAMGRL